MDIFKIMVAGGTGVGKTTFIEQVSEIGVLSTDEGALASEPQIALDFGRLTADERSANLNVLYLFGDPGSGHLPVSQYPERLTPTERCGVIVLVNSTVRNRYAFHTPTTLAYLRRLSPYPFIVAVNRWDWADALPLEKIKALWGIQNTDRLMLCNSTNRVEVCDVLLELFKSFPKDEATQKMMDRIEEQRAIKFIKPDEQQPRFSHIPSHHHLMDAIKIFVSGGVHADKLAFIQHVSEIDILSDTETVAIEKQVSNGPPYGTTIDFPKLDEPIPFCFGRFTVDYETVLYLMSDQGSGKFPAASQTKYPRFLDSPNLCGVVVLVDAADPASISAAQSVLHDLRHGPFAYLLAVKGDTQSIRAALDLNDQEFTVACDPQNRSEVCATLIDLIGIMPAYRFSPRIIEGIRALQNEE